MDKIKSWQNGIYKESAFVTQEVHGVLTENQTIKSWNFQSFSVQYLSRLSVVVLSVHLSMYSEAQCVKKFVPNLPFYTFFLFFLTPFF